VAPTVTNVTSTTTNGAYTVGATPPILVDFSETVTVVTSGGTPSILMATGSTNRAAPYAAGSGTTRLNFTYTVQAGDTSADLDYVATNSLALNGGTIRDAAGNSATLTLPATGGAGSLAANKALVIDTTPPSLVSATLGSSGTSLVLTYSETLSATTAATNRFTVSRSTGGAISVSAVAASGSTITLTISTVYGGQAVTVSYADLQPGINDSLAIQDPAGNDADSFTNQAVTNNSTQTLTQSISITSLGTSSKIYPYGQGLSITTSGSSGSGAITYAVTDGTASGCALSDTTSATTSISATSFGTCSLTATIAADATYRTATSAAAIFTFIQASQSSLTITSTTAPYGQSLSLTTSGGSGTGSVSYLVNSGNCSISTATLTSSSTGSCSVTATKAADSNYLAESTTATITITTGSATATIAFASTTMTFGITNAITVTVSTAGTVRFSANGKVIRNCKEISTVSSGSITATCSYRPATRRPLTITARLSPTDTNIAERTSTSAQFLVGRRTGVRG
jgi:hypothetical protein